MASEDPSTFTGAHRDLVTGLHNDKADLPEVVVGVRIEDVEDPPGGETFRAPPAVGGESDEQLRLGMRCLVCLDWKMWVVGADWCDFGREDLSERHVNVSS
jgi:hypothetical protein